MEVADQWRREWAGTAEYGKVTEGGVTRRVARAMEVLHATGPGSRVRVLRAAYHSSAGPGIPAASYMLHSSRRVISSGFNLLDSPTTPTKPLEISSVPLESSPERNTDTENYKVTEPDDYEISEPSKWRSSKDGSSIRMPSEESSSTDNASIIDIDSRNGRNLHRKYSYDSECSDIQFGKRNSTRASPLLDPPVSLSTLKYKSLLNSSNEWNTRRKSYSFEDTSPLNETILHSNDTLAMESSTDSGICKSTEIVNDHSDDNTHIKYFPHNERKINNNDESFRDWLSRNRPSSHYKTTKFKTYREHDILLEDPVENNITLQSSGKVLITLPVTVGADVENHKKSFVSEDGERKVKKVEFCKTEVHFAAETGKVNIIATDEKPPPSNDFRRRRSAFVPMQDMIDKPITLFGERSIIDSSLCNGLSDTFNNSSNGEFGEPDENTAATKSILKNKIPKPKPYLLGENMRFGLSDELVNKDHYNNDSVLTAVSLVNRQLESENRCDSEIKSILSHDADSESFKTNVFRTISKGPIQDNVEHEKLISVNVKSEFLSQDSINKSNTKTKSKFNTLQASPVQGSLKTRQLRDSDLTYFGIENDGKRMDSDKIKFFENKLTSRDSIVDDNIFHSVKLIQQVSNSVCSSEVESEDSPEYQNIPINTYYAPIPTPRIRSKYDPKLGDVGDVKVLKPILEKESNDSMESIKASTRRSKIRRQEEVTTNRSLSAPPKSLRNNSLEKSHKREDRTSRSSKYESLKENTNVDALKKSSIISRNISDDNPIYVNLNTEGDKISSKAIAKFSHTNSLKKEQKKTQKNDVDTAKRDRKTSASIADHISNNRTKAQRQTDSQNENGLQKTSLKKHSLPRRTDKPEKSQGKSNNEPHTTRNAHKSRENRLKGSENSIKREEHRSRSSQRPSQKSIAAVEEVTPSNTSHDQCVNNSNYKEVHDENAHHKTKSSREKTSPKIEAVKQTQDLISTSTSRYSTTAASKYSEKEITPKSKTHKANKRSEYVINYDDKNGTVSSVKKVRSGLGTPRRKKTSKEVLRETPKENTLTTKALNKIALLQLEDHQREPNGVSSADRKWKTKVHVQRSCQLL